MKMKQEKNFKKCSSIFHDTKLSLRGNREVIIAFFNEKSFTGMSDLMKLGCVLLESE